MHSETERETFAGELAARVLLDTGTGAFGAVRELWHVERGWHVAGSGVRFQARDSWLSTARGPGGTKWGQHFATEEEAREHFNRYTTPVVEVR